MSAECSKCGFDIVYPVGTWPLGVCQNCEQQDEIARLREFGEHYSGAAQDAWDRIVVLEKALEEAERDFNKVSTRMTMDAVNSVGNMIDNATARISTARGYPLAAGSATPGGAGT